MVVLEGFWKQARTEIEFLPEALPEAWSFGETPDHADELLGLVLAGTKTGTASSLWDYEKADPLPQVGDINIVLDSANNPRAIIRIYDVQILPFNEVTAEHAYAEGEDDRTLKSWRAIHENFWRNHSQNPRGFEPDMPVVCERFELIYPRSGNS